MEKKGISFSHEVKFAKQSKGVTAFAIYEPMHELFLIRNMSGVKATKNKSWEDDEVLVTCIGDSYEELPNGKIVFDEDDGCLFDTYLESGLETKFKKDFPYFNKLSFFSLPKKFKGTDWTTISFNDAKDLLTKNK